MAIEKNFSKFDSKDYLKEYYSNIGRENLQSLKCLNKIYDEIKKCDTLLEFGGGPTIYQLISASKKAKKIIFSEYLKNNRKEVKNWLKGKKDSFNWDLWIKKVLELEGKNNSVKDIKRRKEIIKKEIKKVIKCNAKNKNSIKRTKKEKFDVVSVCFVPESATNKEETYKKYMKNITSLIKKDGYLVMGLLKNAHFYNVGRKKFPAFPIDEEYIKNLLLELGFKEIKLYFVKAEHTQGYDGLIFLKAKNKS